MIFKKSIAFLLILVLTACSMPSLPSADQNAPDPTDSTTPRLTPRPHPTSTPQIESTTAAAASGGEETASPKAEMALLVGDYSKAIQLFEARAAAASDPVEIARAQSGIGQAHYHDGSLAAALDYLRPASQSSDPTVASRAFYFLGQTFTELERYTEALDAFQSYLNLQPGILDDHVHTLRGNLYNITGDYAQAIAAYQNAFLTADPADAENLSVKIAIAYHDSGDLTTALSLYLDIYNTTENEYTKAQMDLLMGRIYLAQGNTEQAYAAFQDAVNNYPFAYDSYSALVALVNDGVPVNELNRGLINYNIGQYVLAIEAFNRYLETAPQDFADTALYYKALAQRAAGIKSGESQADQAIATWQFLIETYPTSIFFIDAWEDIEYTQWAYMGEYAASAETCLNFVARYPEAAQAPTFLFRAGRSLERGGLLVEAAQTWERLANEYPAAPETFRGVFFAGISQYRLGNLAEAQRLFNRALVLSTEPADIAAAQLWIGKCFQAQGDFSNALDIWKQAQTADPFGYYSIRAEDLLLDRALFTPPESVSLSPSLLPYRPEAETWLRTAFNIPTEISLESPGDLANDPRYQRGLEFWALGQYEMAKSEFESLRLTYDGDPIQTFKLIQAFVDIGLYRSALIASTQLLKLAGLEGAAALEAPEYFTRVRFGLYYLDWVQLVAEAEDFSPLFLLALIRQESNYEGFIKSSAGARGLMQIIPSTGAQLAAELGWPENYTDEDLYRPYVSLYLGTIYLSRQRQYFEGDLYDMLAAYNGGPGNTIAWNEIAQHDPDLFLEVVRIQETRDYIRLITEIHYIYRWLYGDSPIP